MSATAPAAVDERLPCRRLVPFCMKHVSVMAATPIASVFLMIKALNLRLARTDWDARALMRKIRRMAEDSVAAAPIRKLHDGPAVHREKQAGPRDRQAA